MAKSVIMPALGMAQESGVLISWLKRDGEAVTQGEPLMEIETDKATVEIEAPASGFLGGILAKEGDVVPVGQTIAWILAAGEQPPVQASPVSVQSEGKLQAPSRNASVRSLHWRAKLPKNMGSTSRRSNPMGGGSRKRMCSSI